MSRIVSILPKAEGFSARQFGAVALCVRDFTRFSRHKAQITVIGGMPGESFDSIRYIAAPPARWYEKRTRAYARACAEIINREQAELAEIHNRPALLQMIAQKTSCRLALHLHNDPQDMDGTQTPGKRMKLLSGCAGVYCVSNFIRDRFLEGLPGMVRDKLRVIHNGIELPASLPLKERLIVFAGRMTQEKGALLLAQALRQCLPKLPEWRVVLIGSRRHEAGNPPTTHEKAIVAALKPLGAQVTLTGFIGHEEAMGYFGRASIAVVPSVWEEPFGRTALEAMAYGCAVISSGRGALPEVTGDAALTLPQVTEEALSHAILTLAGDEALIASHARLARERAAYYAIADRTRVLDEARDSILAGGNRHVA